MALIHLYKNKEKDKDGFVVINVDDILFLRGYSKDKMKERKQAHYKKNIGYLL